MKSESRQILASIIVTTLLAAFAVHRAESPILNNLVINPSFEQSGSASLPEAWHGDSSVYASDSQQRHSGTSSLRYVNTDAGRYRLCSQKVPVSKGWKCRFGPWIKTKDIRGAESGATVCLEWQDARGKWLGGSYPHGIKGTRNWTRLKKIARVPEDAVAVTLACYVHRGMTGTAWFDDVELTHIVDPPMQVIMRSPVYRGWIASHGPEREERVDCVDLRDYNVHLQDVRLHARLSDAHGTTLWQSPELAGAKSLDVDVPIRGLLFGNYDLAHAIDRPEWKRDTGGPPAFAEAFRLLLSELSIR